MIYFDHNATTPILDEIQEVMQEAMSRFWGNPSSAHRMGKEAHWKLENCRERLASLLRVKSKEVYFTSGGTEADNLAILGSLQTNSGNIVVSAFEHPAIFAAARHAEKQGVELRIVPIKENGQISLEKLEDLVDDKTQIVSIMFANNEIGTVQPYNEIGKIVKRYNNILHSDAVQAFGKVPLNIQENLIDSVSVSSHKIYGPKGCGAIYIDENCTINPRTFGGGQEKNVRTGTQNLPAIMGFVRAAEIAFHNMEKEKEKLCFLTNYMFDKISTKNKNIIRNGDSIKRIPGTLNISIPGVVSGNIVETLNEMDIFISGGSACDSASAKPSQTLLALGRNREEAIAGVRVSLGRFSTQEEVDLFVEKITHVIAVERDS